MTAGWNVPAEVADQTNAYGLSVGPVSWRSAAVSAGDLVAPAESDLNLAVAAAIAVADYKIVPNTLPFVAVSVVIVKKSSISPAGEGMVYYYSFPLFFYTRRWQPVPGNISIDICPASGWP